MLSVLIRGCDGKIRQARELLRNNGAVETHQTEQNVVGLFEGSSKPDSARADRIVEAITTDMKQDRFKGMWLEDVYGGTKKELWP